MSTSTPKKTPIRKAAAKAVPKPVKKAVAAKKPVVKKKVVKAPKLNKSTPAGLMRLVKRACKALDARKGVDVAVLDVSELSTVSDVIIVATGMNQPHLRALVEEVVKVMRAGKPSLSCHRRCGERGCDWIALDYIEFVVHVFTPAMREYYALEALWKDAPRIEI